MNSVQILGQVAREFEGRYTKNGKPVLELVLNIPERTRDGTHRQTSWVPVTVWGKPAERIASQIQVGSTVIVMGKLETKRWQDQSGQWQNSWTVNAWFIEPISRDMAPHQDDDIQL